MVFTETNDSTDTSGTLYKDNATNFYYNPSTNTLVAGTFSGSGSGLSSLNASNLSSGTVPSARLSGTYGISISGNAATASTASACSGNSATATNATNATNFNVAADNSTNSTHYITFTGGASGNQRPNSDTGLTYNPSSNTLSTGTFSGSLSGTASNASALNGQAASYYLNYNNLNNKPTIPTNNNQLTNGAGYITSAPGTNLGNSTSSTTVTVTSSTGNNTTLPTATASAAGVMSAADKSKLDGVSAGGPTIIAWGTINSNGSKAFGSNNWSSSWQDVGGRSSFVITLTSGITNGFIIANVHDAWAFMGRRMSNTQYEIHISGNRQYDSSFVIYMN
jgi:hypothetical protein